MAAMKVDPSDIIGSIAKIGLSLYLTQRGVPAESSAMISDFSEGIIKSFRLEKKPDMLRDFQHLVRQSIKDTLENHEFVFEIDQIDVITEAILSTEQLRNYLGENSVDLLRINFISALDSIHYPYIEHNLDVDELLKTILHKIYDGIHKDPDLINLDSNKKIDELIEKLDKLFNFVQTPEDIPHNLTDMDSFLTESVLHREKEISELADILTDQKMTMITGIGGVGKTALARAVCEVVKADFQHIAWLTYDGSLDAQLPKLRIGLGNPDPGSRLLQIKGFLNTVEDPVLLVLDNVNDKPSRQDLKTLNSFSPHVQVLLTSRLPQIRGVKAYPIDFLPLEACLDIFYTHYKRDKERENIESALKIITAVCRHTLTVELIARTAQWESEPLPEVLKKMQGSGFTGFDTQVESAWEPDPHTIRENIKRLYNMTSAEMDAEKRKILRIFSILPSSSPIPIAIKDWIPCDMNNLKWLVDRGWLQRAGGAFNIHQMVGESIKLQEDPSLEDCQGLISFFSESTFVPRDMVYTEAAARLALSDALIAWFQPAPMEEAFALFLHNTAFSHKNNLADYPKAFNYYQKALVIREQVLGKEHPDTAATYNNLAGVYQAMGNFPQALDYYQKDLEISEKVLGKEHPSTATTYNNLACVYQAMGNFPQALDYYQKDLEISEKVLGKGHPDTATTYNNLAGVYQDMGDFPQALDCYQKALQIKEKVLGKEHPSTAATYNNLAGVYQAMGNFPQALDYYQKALQIKEKVLGKEHPSTAATYNNLALVYQDMGNFPQALDTYQKALEIKEKVLGKGHPSTATTYNNLAGVYQAMGDFPQALEYYLNSMTIFFHRLGADHPNTKVVINNLTQCYKDSDVSAKPFETWLKEQLEQMDQQDTKND
jgi:tetratricopeptide (TPR) repeat protein